MGFREPFALLLLPLVLIVWYLSTVLVLRRQHLRSLLQFPFSADLKLLQWIPSVFFVLFVIALARPYDSSRKEVVPQKATDVLFVVDVSHSMLARDVSPSRLEMAKRIMYDLLKVSEERRSETRFGIVLFAGGSYLFCPLTFDLEVVQRYIEEISTELVSDQGSALGDALSFVESLQRGGEVEADVIFVLSDGEAHRTLQTTLSTNPPELYFVGIGTPAGSPVPLPNGSFLQDRDGSTVVSTLEEVSLERAARSLNSTYLRASPTGSNVRNLFRSLAEGQREQFRTVYHFREIGHWFLWIAAAVLLLLRILPLKAGLVSLLPLMFLCTPLDLAADSPEIRTLKEARRAYREKRFREAKTFFEERFNEDPGDARIAHALGSTYYQLGDFAQAEEIFQKAARLSDTWQRKRDAFYNAANAALKQRKAAEAVSLYDRALELDPAHKPSLENRHLATQIVELLRTPESLRPTLTPTPTSTPTPAAPNPTPTPDPSATPTPTPTPSAAPSVPGTPKKKKGGGEGGEGTPKASPSGTPGEITPSASPASPSPSPDGTPSASPSPDGGKSDGAQPSPAPAPSPSLTPDEEKKGETSGGGSEESEKKDGEKGQPEGGEERGRDSKKEEKERSKQQSQKKQNRDKRDEDPSKKSDSQQSKPNPPSGEDLENTPKPGGAPQEEEEDEENTSKRKEEEVNRRVQLGKEEQDILPTATPDAAALSQQAAERWLDSLPEAPLILRRRGGTSRSESEEPTW